MIAVREKRASLLPEKGKPAVGRVIRIPCQNTWATGMMTGNGLGSIPVNSAIRQILRIASHIIEIKICYNILAI